MFTRHNDIKNVLVKKSSASHIILMAFCLTLTALNLNAQDSAPLNTAASANQNYILISVPRIPGYGPGATGYLTNDLMQTVEYFDGLGRPLQTVQVKGSAALNDVVQPYIYDQLGRVDSAKYMPFTTNLITPGAYQPTALGTSYLASEQYVFYQPPYKGYVNTNNPYSKMAYELSPLNRPIEQGAQGAAWQLSTSGITGSGHTIKIVYSTNDETVFTTTPVASNPGSKKVALYSATVGSNQVRTLVRTGGTATYTPGELYLTITKNENWATANGCLGTTEEYTDKLGRMVLKRTYNQKGAALEMLSTYYVYDDMGNLAFVLPPLASPDAATPSQTVLNNLCYQYQYDERNRLVQKKLPGKGWEYIVYNTIDQPVATQDSLQRHNIQWIFTKYDAIGRPVMTGIWASTAVTRPSLQTTVDALTTLWETPVITGTGYTTVAWPTSATTPLTINYYDFYTGNLPVPAAYAAPAGSTTHMRGLLTATRTAVLNTLTDVLWSVNYYDDLGRNIQTYQQHYLGGTANTSNYDAISSTYNFTNAVTTTIRKHFTTASTTVPKVTISNKFIYDHVGRQLETWQQIQNAALTADTMKLVSKLVYNEIGQLLTKQLHSKDSVNFLQSVTSSYNERGWLLSSASSLFNLQLAYNAGTAPQFNGNITSQSWSSTGSTGSFAYSYDWLNRLTSGKSSDNKYIERGITYDQGGNISTLSRVYNDILIDSLTYSYLSGTNQTDQLWSLVDKSTDASGLGHKTGTTAYTYDGNANLLTDPSKGTSGITYTYNLLNQPQTVTALSTTYTYDANGEKLKRVVGTAVTDYINGIQYDGTAASETISFLPTPEGRALPNGTTLYNYEYNLTDHLGSIRLNFDTGNGVAREQQQDNYMPFGMDISVVIPSPPNYYLYNGKEIQSNLQVYDYGSRQYDPVIGRWNVIDRYAEKYNAHSPYAYVLDNPVKAIDINGDSLLISFNNQNYLYQNGKLFQNGSEYKGKVRGFLKDAASALGKINGGKEGASMLSELEGSKNNFILENGSSHFKENDAAKAYSNELLTDPSQAGALQALNNAGKDLTGGSGGTIFWDPTGTELPTTNGGQTNPVTDLAHEMFHGLDANRGLLNDKITNGIKTDEWQAVYRENILRGQLGEPLRTNYIKSVDPLGNYVGGAGPSMLTPANQPVLPAGYNP